MPMAILVAGVMAGAVYALFRTPLMVVLLTAFMLDAKPDLIALIVLAIATVMIVMPPLQKRLAARQAARRARRRRQGRPGDRAPSRRSAPPGRRSDPPTPAGRCAPAARDRRR